MTKAGIKQLLKFGVSLLLLFFTLRLIDWRGSLELAGRANLGLMAVAVGLLLTERILSTSKWLLLLRAKGSPITFWRLLVINYIGGFWGLVLPSSVSADIVRGYYLSKSTANVSLAVTSMVIDRLMGALSLVLLGCVSAWMVGDTFGLANARLIAAAVAVVCTLGIALLFHNKFIHWVDRRIIKRVADRKIIHQVRRWIVSCLQYRQYPQTLVASFLLTGFVQILRILVFYAVAVGFGIHVPVTYYFIFVPLMMLLIILPISINGIGVREGSFVAFFALVGVPSSQAFIVSFVVSVLTTLMTAFGGVVYMFDKNAIKPMT
ncbi:MAG: flippase-like domain-containing protein [Verrucomicrobia bacterium]|nr:flippase-like domain-containing protein [Verrucomicrobiota bacterium]MBU1856202.1 flippase-like domain-containing protein [Verrucomicrobiota bacterium]